MYSPYNTARERKRVSRVLRVRVDVHAPPPPAAGTARDDQRQDREDRSARRYLAPGTRFRARGGERVYPRARRKNAEEVTAAAVAATIVAATTAAVVAANATASTGAHASRFY